MNNIKIDKIAEAAEAYAPVSNYKGKVERNAFIAGAHFALALALPEVMAMREVLADMLALYCTEIRHNHTLYQEQLAAFDALTRTGGE